MLGSTTKGEHTLEVMIKVLERFITILLLSNNVASQALN